MGHSLAAFIGEFDGLQRSVMNFPEASVVKVPQNFGLLPVTDSFFDEVTKGQPGNLGERFHIFYHLSEPLVQFAKDASQQIKVAYVETDYFGGLGTQSAVVWSDGEIVFGPSQTETSWEDGLLKQPPITEWAIDQALQLLGVQKADAFDEFDAIGLGQHRSTDDWIE